jgi:hypothetical protein
MSPNYNSKLWHELLENGEKNQSNKEINVLDLSDIETIVATIDFFNGSNIWFKQTILDLKVCKYRVFDWLAMCVNGRNDDDRRTNNTALKVLIYAFMSAGYDEKKFIENLRIYDYDSDRKWEYLRIDL